MKQIRITIKVPVRVYDLVKDLQKMYTEHNKTITVEELCAEMIDDNVDVWIASREDFEDEDWANEGGSPD